MVPSILEMANWVLVALTQKGANTKCEGYLNPFTLIVPLLETLVRNFIQYTTIHKWDNKTNQPFHSKSLKSIL
jgi:hypothetical protein